MSPANKALPTLRRRQRRRCPVSQLWVPGHPPVAESNELVALLRLPTKRHVMLYTSEVSFSSSLEVAFRYDRDEELSNHFDPPLDHTEHAQI